MKGKLAMAAISCVLTASAVAKADVLNPICTQTSPGEYKLSWKNSGDTHKVEILAATTAGDLQHAKSLQSTEAQELTVHFGQPGERVYFYLRPDSGAEREVAVRRIALEGTPNFRDLGGYETTDGKFVRWGMLYRSGVLSYLTAKDLKTLNALGLRVVCDFRSVQENEAAPETFEGDLKTERLSLPIDTNPSGGASREDPMKAFLASNPTPEQLRHLMGEFYKGFAFLAAPQFARAFDELKQNHLPLAYHCTAGKDRTGVFSAFVLLTLGVPEDTVVKDYALTNQYLAEGMNTEAARKMMGGAEAQIFARLSPEQRQALMAADPEYLRNTLRAIDAKFGNFDNYRRQVLHFSDADRDQLRERLLTQR